MFKLKLLANTIIFMINRWVQWRNAIQSQDNQTDDGVSNRIEIEVLNTVLSYSKYSCLNALNMELLIKWHK